MTPPTTTDEIRKAYLDFFAEREHLVTPSSSLIPVGDPTLLLTSAGMVQFKSYFSGEAEPPNPRLASSQKCFRTTDIENVGDTKHLTFFEMLGNFSIGDYFKKEAIAWSWEFVTKVLELPEERLWVSVYLDDDEAEGYWREIGVPAERIVRYGDEDNFWGPAGEEGPCGPCSEIHYDYGEEYGADLTPADSGERFVEIWNLVFTQFYHHRDGTRTKLPAPNIDTGMGLERTATIMQGRLSAYESDAFDYLLVGAAKLAGKSYGADEQTDYALRVLAEHARSVTFLIADGVTPSNEGRGYVLRRILRRAVRFARKAGIEGAFLGGLAALVIEKMAHQYPELERERETVLSVIRAEEERFGQTLQQGMAMLRGFLSAVEVADANLAAAETKHERRDGASGALADLRELHQAPEGSAEAAAGWPFIAPRLRFAADRAENIKRRWDAGDLDADRASRETGAALRGAREAVDLLKAQTPGEVAFKLYDTFGFPLDITIDVAREHGMSVDVEGFERELEAQRERSRAAAKFGLGEKVVDVSFSARAGKPRVSIAATTEKTSVFTGYESTEQETTLVELRTNREPPGSAARGDAVQAGLLETPFYVEAGGQVGDVGVIKGPRGWISVDVVRAERGRILHEGKVIDGEVAAGEPVTARVDAVRRADVTRNHTGTHLLHAALRQVLGPHVRQAGSLVAPDRLRFDFSHPSGLSGDELREIERMVNGRVLDNLPVVHRQMGYQEAIDNGALAFFGDKYGDVVRTCRIGAPDGEPFSFELCGGTHTGATGEIGLLHVESEGGIGAGTRRIEAVTGRGTEGVLSERHVLMESLAKQLQTAPADLQSRVAAVLEDLDRERKRASVLERALAKREADGLAGGAQDVDGVAVLASEVTASTMEALRGAADSLRRRIESGVIVLGSVIDGKPAFVATVSKDLTAEGYHAGNIIREVAKVTGGGGGGRPDMAQAGGKDASKLAEALALAPELVKKR